MSAAKRLLSAINSPWTWPVIPLLATAVVGQWVSMVAAEAVAAACAAIGIGFAIGLAVAGKRAGIGRMPPDLSEGTTSVADPSSHSVVDGPSGEGTRPVRATDLRGAMLADTTLVRVDLRNADLRGASLRGADLRGADLTGARLGPLEEGSEGSGPAS